MYKTSRGEDVGEFFSDLFSKITPHTSDIHIHTQEHGVDVGIREYGELKHLFIIKQEKYDEIKRRLKIYCRIRIDIEEKGQDGSFSVYCDDIVCENKKIIFIRVSFLPTVYGQTIVLRLSGHRESGVSLEDIVKNKKDVDLLRRGIAEKNGLIVVTGPTGSGKTETLYILMREIIKQGRSVVSIEDPVESYVRGVKQVRVSEDYGFTFKMALKSVLRQDPDVIVVGETRDQETAELVDLASHTGHLVITTLHVGSISDIPERLFQLGVTRESLSSSAVMFVGQRLLKVASGICGVDGGVAGDTVFKREAIFEIGFFDKKLRIGLIESNNSYEFHEKCREEGILLFKDRTDIFSSK